MNFESTYKKILDGTATEEEKAFVSSEMEKIRKISEILESSPIHSEEIVSQVDEDDIKEAKKRYKRKTLIKIISLIVISLLAIAVIVCSIIFVPPIMNARSNENISTDEALDLAEEFLSDYTGEDASKYMIRDVDKDLRMRGGAKNAVYDYEIEFKTPDGIEYTVEVSTKSGYVMLTDIDR